MDYNQKIKLNYEHPEYENYKDDVFKIIDRRDNDGIEEVRIYGRFRHKSGWREEAFWVFSYQLDIIE